jgi:polyhydroxybutyrate depolymerase
LNSDEIARISGLSRQSDFSAFIVAHPNGTGEAKSWNRVHDVGFTRALPDELSGLVNPDASGVYATGFPKGAIFVYRIAAVAPVAAKQIRDDQNACRPARTMPIIHFHVPSDVLNPYAGGMTSAGFQILPVEEAVAFWVELDACEIQVETAQSGNVRRDVHAPCAQGAAIELYTIVGGEHAWPGGEAVSPQIGEPTKETNASAWMREFFAAHPMP